MQAVCRGASREKRYHNNNHHSIMPNHDKWNKKRNPPPGFDYIEPVLEALENELRDKVKESNLNKRKTESTWPVYQINWQRSRYVYDMYYTYHKISKQVYDYCLQQKLVDAALIAKWKKPGYERLCSTFVINPSNYKFGTTSICRVPLYDRSGDQKLAQDPTTGCLGCASGKGAGPRNIFGNKYGQYLAAVQVAREERLEQLHRQKQLDQDKKEREKQQQQREREERKQQQQLQNGNDGDDDGEDETDDDDGGGDNDESTDDEDYGPTPAAGVWAGSQKLQGESERFAAEIQGDDHGNDGDDHDGNENERQTSKRQRTE